MPLLCGFVILPAALRRLKNLFESMVISLTSHSLKTLLFVVLPLLLALFVNNLTVIRQLDLHYIDGLVPALARGIAADTAIVALCWLLLPLLAGRRSGPPIFAATMTTALFLLVADSICFYFSLARLNTGVLHDINIYAIKAVLTAGDVLVLLLLICLLFVFALGAYKLAAGFAGDSAEQRRRQLRLILVVVLGGAAAQLIPLRLDEPTAAPLWTGELAQLNKNSFLQNLGSGIFVNIWNARPGTQSVVWQPFSEKDTAELRGMGLMRVPPTDVAPPEKPFKRVVVLIHESLALDYFHSINAVVPAAASDFLDELLQKYPSAKDFRNSSYPTLQGLITLLCSKVPPEYHLIQKTGSQSLFQLMRQQHGTRGILITGNSRFYGGENVIFKNILGVDEYISYEDLAHEYPEPPVNDWGFHDDVVYDKTLKVMQQQRDRSYLLLAKTIDMHQPPSYCGLPADRLPPEVASHPSQVVRSIYWTNHCLRQFFAAVAEKGLLDDETLVIVTADHYPMPNYGHSDLIGGEYYLYSRLPLIFVSGRTGLASGKTLDQLCCQLDFAPALCRLTDTRPAASFMGYDLFTPVPVPRAIGFYNNVFNLETASGAVNFPINLAPGEYPAIARWINNTLAPLP